MVGLKERWDDAKMIDRDSNEVVRVLPDASETLRKCCLFIE